MKGIALDSRQEMAQLWRKKEAPEEVATHAWGSQGSAIRARVRVHAKGAHGWSGEVLTWCATTVVGGGDVDGGGSCGCEVEEEGEEIRD